MDSHAVIITNRDGSTSRFGADESSVSRIVLDLTFDTKLNGGYDTASVTVPKPDEFDSAAAKDFEAIRVYIAETNETLYAGRVSGTPQVDETSISIDAEGWSNHLNDDKTVTETFLARDLSAWGEPSTQRKINVLAIGAYDYSKSSVSTSDASGASGPAILITYSEFGTLLEIAEVWYRGVNEIGQIKYDYIVPKAGTEIEGSLHSSTDLVGTELSAASKTYGITAEPNQTLLVPEGSKYAIIQQVYPGSFTGSSTGDTYGWANLRVKGRHGLTAYSEGAEEGFRVSDMAGYIVEKFAPLLRFTTGLGGTIEPTTYPVTHADYQDETTAGTMLSDLSIYGGNNFFALDYGCYGDDGKEFFLRTPGTYGKTWIARTDTDAQDTSAGPDSTSFINGIKIVFDPNGSGEKKSVGPPDSGSTVELVSLADEDPTNPANNDGAHHWEVRDIGIAEETAAILVGELELATRNNQDWRGDIVLKGNVEDEAGNFFPVGLVRSGDEIVVANDEDTRPRRIVSTSYKPGEVSVSIGAPPDRISAILARIGNNEQSRGVN